MIENRQKPHAQADVGGTKTGTRSFPNRAICSSVAAWVTTFKSRYSFPGGRGNRSPSIEDPAGISPPVLLARGFVLLPESRDAGHDHWFGTLFLDPVVAALVSSWPSEDRFKRQLELSSWSLHQHRGVLLWSDFTTILDETIAHEANALQWAGRGNRGRKTRRSNLPASGF